MRVFITLNRVLFLLILLSFLVVFIKTSQAKNFNAVVTTDIVDNISITERTAMDFGLIAVDAAGDTIRLRTNNNFVITNGSISLGGQQYGLFRVEGTPNSSVSVSFSTGDMLSGPGADMPIGNFETNRGTSFTINGSGRRDFRMGATLFPAAGQLGGVYSGTYTVTVNYD